MKSLLHYPYINSTIFNSDNERFNKNFCLNEKIRRENEYYTKGLNREKHRVCILERE